MKKILFTFFLLFGVCLSSLSQSHQFDNYFVKSKALTGDRIVKFHKKFQIEHLEKNHYKIKVDLEPTGELLVTVKFTEKSFFAGKTYYEYSGQGVFRGKRVKFVIESGRDLKDFSSGVGYPQHSNMDLSLFIIKTYYWLFNQKEPLLKNSISFFPIANPKIEAEEIPDTNKIIKKFIESVALNNPRVLSKKVRYPLKVFLDAKNIENESEFIEAYYKIFTKDFKEAIINSNINKDWGGRIYEGLMFRNGDLWIDFEGNIIAINYIP